MTVPIPTLDDLRYRQLVDTLLAEIPLIESPPAASTADAAPGAERPWTDHNPSDPGIALLELLAAMAESTLYRCDVMPAAVRTSFLRMVLDRPEPVTCEVRLQRPAPSPSAVNIPAGTRIGGSATAEIFETTAAATIPAGADHVLVAARHRSVEPGLPRALGAYSGEGFEVELATRDPLHPDQALPVLLDPGAQVGPGYDPNPRIEITSGGVREEWTWVEDFLEADPGARVFTVEWLTYRLRFGARRPPAGAEVALTHLQRVRGREVQGAAPHLDQVVRTTAPLAALPPGLVSPPAPFTPGAGPGSYFDGGRQLLVQVGSLSAARRDALLQVAPGAPALPAAYSDAVQGLFEVSNLLVLNPSRRFPGLPLFAAGGRYLLDMGNAESEGLRELKTLERAITARDFEWLAQEAFNALTEANGPKVARAHARRRDDIGTMDVVLVPEPTRADRRFEDPSDELLERVRQFLDARRLITTVVRTGPPSYRPVTVSTTLVVCRSADTARLLEHARAVLEAYLDPITGGDGGDGWPLGRGVYRSDLFRLLHDLGDIKYVERLELDGSTATDVALSALELPQATVQVSLVVDDSRSGCAP